MTSDILSSSSPSPANAGPHCFLRPDCARERPQTPSRRFAKRIVVGLIALAAMSGAVNLAQAQAAKSEYRDMATLEQYRIASRAEEIALARSAAPASISDEASVLALESGGYETVARGKNGFVCLVERSWTTDFSDPEFWNPKVRSPICLNPASVRSILPGYLKRTEWALAGASKADMVERTKAALTARAIPFPEVGAMAYMMSKGSYLSDAAGGHWTPHLMFFLPRMAAAEWGANIPDGPVMGGSSEIEPVTTFFVPVGHWSDGDTAAAFAMSPDTSRPGSRKPSHSRTW